MYQLSIIDSATNQKVYVEMPIEETGKLYISRKTAQNRFFTAEDFLNDKEKNIAFFKGAGYYNGKNNYEVFLFKKSKNDDTYYYVDSVQTVKKKSAEALKSIDLSSSYPQYVQDLLQENINKQGLNIISLYKLGFKEGHFKLFKKIFKSYNKLSYDRFLTLYIFLSEYSDCNVLENIFSVLKNNIMSFDKSVAFFFSEFMRIIDNKLLLDNKVLKDTATYILNNEFFLKKTEIQGRLLGQRKGKIIESFTQYPDVQEEYYGDKFNIKRINKILDCPAYVISCIDDLCASFYIDVLHNAIAPNQNELAFQFTLYNSDEDKFYVKVDTATQNILVFFADTNVNHKLFCRCLYNSKNSFPYYIQNHSKQDEFKFVVNEVQSFVYDKVFPKIIDNKISSLLSI